MSSGADARWSGDGKSEAENANGAMLPGWREALIEFIRTQAKPPDKFSHQARLYRLATQLACGAPYDDEVVFAAAWLHDLGVFVGHRPDDPKELALWDNVAYACAKAPAVLCDLGFPNGKIPAVVEAIRTHVTTAVPTSFEGDLLRDADLLEQLGAVGILRTVSKVGRDTRFCRFAEAIEVVRRNVESLPGQMRLPATRVMAESRVRLAKAFAEAAAAEAAGIEW